MKRPETWLPTIIPLIAVIIIVVNTWALELFKLSKLRPKNSEKNKQGAKNDDKTKINWRVIKIAIFGSAIFYFMFKASLLAMFPTDKPNADSFAISVHIGTAFFVLIMYFFDMVAEIEGRIINALIETNETVKKLCEVQESESEILNKTAKTLTDIIAESGFSEKGKSDK
jgi:hypothetical protein